MSLVEVASIEVRGSMSMFFVRSRGKLAGPFDVATLQHMAKRGRLTRFDQISEDKTSWRSAGDVADIFPAAARRGAVPASAIAADNGAFGLRGDAARGSRGANEPAAGFFYAQNGVAVGPVTLSVLQLLATNGTLRADDQVWVDGSDIATQARQVPMLASVFSVNHGVLAYAGSAAGRPDAGFWLRVVAFILDSVVTFLMAAMVGGAIAGVWAAFVGADRLRDAAVLNVAAAIGVVIQMVVPWLYFTLSECSTAQATLGKRALSLIVTDEAGARITFARANGRYFAKFVSSLIFGLGFLVAAFSQRKQALHDMMCSTYVVQK